MKISGLADSNFNNFNISSSIKNPVKNQENNEFIENSRVKRVIDPDQVRDAVDKMNETSRIFNRSLHFRLHEESKRWQVQVIDLDSGKVIREIPPTEILDLVAKIQEIVGVFVDERR